MQHEKKLELLEYSYCIIRFLSLSFQFPWVSIFARFVNFPESSERVKIYIARTVLIIYTIIYMHENIYRRNTLQKQNIDYTKYKIWKLKLILKLKGKINTSVVLNILYYTYWRDHTCLCLKYANMRFFSGQFFLYKNRIEGCFGKYLDSVLTRRKSNKRRVRLLTFLWSVFGLFSPSVSPVVATAIIGIAGAATNYSEF